MHIFVPPPNFTFVFGIPCDYAVPCPYPPLIMLCCGGRIRPFKECAKRSSCKQKSLILMPTTAATTTPPPVVFTTADPLLLQTTSQVKEVKRIVPPSSSAADAASSVIASYACGGTASYRSAARKLNSVRDTRRSCLSSYLYITYVCLYVCLAPIRQSSASSSEPPTSRSSPPPP